MQETWGQEDSKRDQQKSAPPAWRVTFFLLNSGLISLKRKKQLRKLMSKGSYVCFKFCSFLGNGASNRVFNTILLYCPVSASLLFTPPSFSFFIDTAWVYLPLSIRKQFSLFFSGVKWKYHWLLLNLRLICFYVFVFQYLYCVPFICVFSTQVFLST
jgi:hypothetical protein